MPEVMIITGGFNPTERGAEIYERASERERGKETREERRAGSIRKERPRREAREGLRRAEDDDIDRVLDPAVFAASAILPATLVGGRVGQDGRWWDRGRGWPGSRVYVS